MNEPVLRKQTPSGPLSPLRRLIQAMMRLLFMIFRRGKKRHPARMRLHTKREECDAAATGGGGKPASAKNDKRSAGKSSAYQRGGGRREVPAFEAGKSSLEAARKKEKREEETLPDGKADNNKSKDRKKRKEKPGAELWALTHDWGEERRAETVTQQDVYAAETQPDFVTEAPDWTASYDAGSQGSGNDLSSETVTEASTVSSEVTPDIVSTPADLATDSPHEVAPDEQASVITEATSDIPSASGEIGTEILPEAGAELPAAAADVGTEPAAMITESATELDSSSSVLEPADALTPPDQDAAASLEVNASIIRRSEFSEVMTKIQDIKRQNEHNMKYDQAAEGGARLQSGERGMRAV